mmetsp:Transcript_13812/g.19095  ORF Transcript_13812/g.19095 Transcript_13812/m.19095 type:complete len:263 (-) Transcript_13812:318-1106(-)
MHHHLLRHPRAQAPEVAVRVPPRAVPLALRVQFLEALLAVRVEGVLQQVLERLGEGRVHGGGDHVPRDRATHVHVRLRAGQHPHGVAGAVRVQGGGAEAALRLAEEPVHCRAPAAPHHGRPGRPHGNVARSHEHFDDVGLGPPVEDYLPPRVGQVAADQEGHGHAHPPGPPVQDLVHVFGEEGLQLPAQGVPDVVAGALGPQLSHQIPTGRKEHVDVQACPQRHCTEGPSGGATERSVLSDQAGFKEVLCNSNLVRKQQPSR